MEPEISEAQYQPIEEEVYYIGPEEVAANEAAYAEQANQETQTYRRPVRRQPTAQRATRPVPIENGTRPMNNKSNNRGDWKDNLRRNFPFTENWDLDRLPQTVIPWAAVTVVALIFFMLMGSNRTHTGEPINAIGDNSTDPSISSPVITSTANVNGVIITTTPNIVVTGGSGNKTATTTTAGTPSAKTTAVATNPLTGKIGTVNSNDGINMRKDPSTTSPILTKLKVGTKVTILDGPKNSDNLDWYQVKSGDLTGWVAKTYIDVPAGS
jgi:hypothetical protein